jgi:3-dehydroquinate dehydratase / shikimate dehydrogenase
MSTLLCVPIMVHDEHAALADAQAAHAAGADLVEFRIDEVFSGEAADEERERAFILRLIAGSAVPCIVTCRSASEGGHYDGDDMARVSLYERLGTAHTTDKSIESPPRYIDCELDTYTRSANLKQKVNLAVAHPAQLRDLSTSLILSMHDFNSRPADLTRRLLRARAEQAAAVIKLAFRCRSLRDNLELFDILAERDRPTIALGMGEFGLLSRILAPKFGGFLTFASLRPTSTTAPGQPTVAELLDLYRFRSIKPTTKLLGIIGWPVGHSRSPHVHNAGFEAINFDAVYVPLPIPADDTTEGSDAGYLNFKATVLELLHHPKLDFTGASVTLPHKQNLLRLAREQGWTIDEASAATGASNTLVVNSPARSNTPASDIRVMNTDAPALASSLADVLGPLTGKRIAILGAGGVARAAAWAVAHAGATVIIYARNIEKAQALVDSITPSLTAQTPGPGRLIAAAWDSLPKACCHAFVNCTPIGMTGGPAPTASPITIADLKSCEPDAVFMDTVYTPRLTPMLQQAAAANYRTIDGSSMFIRQAEAQFQAWTNQSPPPNHFAKILA